MDSSRISLLLELLYFVSCLLLGSRFLFVSPMGEFMLEVCVDSLDGAMEAERGGAGRLELCSSLSVGGVTPSYGLMKLVKEHIQIPVHVLIRPRAGDFVYSDLELAVMKADIECVGELGFQGVAVGVLTPSREIDVKAMHFLLQECQRYNLSVTFHRAFDCVVEPLKAIKLISSLERVARVLTSGQESTAAEGIPLLRSLMAEAGSSVRILPGAGITDANATYLVSLLGATELHGSMRKELRVSPSQALLPGDTNCVTWTVDANKVQNVISQCKSVGW